jgi:hypothetical protein
MCMFMPTSECKIEAIQFNHFIGLQETLWTFSKQLWSFIALECGKHGWEKNQSLLMDFLHIEKAFDAWASRPPKRLVWRLKVKSPFEYWNNLQILSFTNFCLDLCTKQYDVHSNLTSLPKWVLFCTYIKHGLQSQKKCASLGYIWLSKKKWAFKWT